MDIKADPSCKLEKDPICRLFTSSDFLEDCFPNEQSTVDSNSNALVKQPTSSSTDDFDTSMISDKGEVGVLSSLTLSENGGEYQNSEISSSYNIGVNELKTEAGNLIPALGLEFASFVNESFPSVLNLNAIERVIVEEVMAYLLKNLEIDNRKGTEVEAFPLPIVSNPSKSDYQNDVSLHCSSCPVNQDTDDNSQVNSIPDEDSKSATLLNNDEELPDNLQLDEALPFLSDTGEKAATANDLLFPESSRASSVATETTQERESDPILAKFTDPSSNREAESRLNTSRPSSREISLESDSQKFHGKSHWFSLKVSKPHWMKNFIQSKRSKNLPVDAEVARAMFDDFMKAEGDLLHSEAARQSDSEAVFARLQQLQEENDKLAAEVASLKEQLQERDAVIQRLRRTVTENARPTLGQIIGSMGDTAEIEEAEGEEDSFFHDYDEAVTPSSRYKRKSYINNYGRNIISVDLEAEMEGIFGSEKLNSQLDRERSAGTKSSSPLPPTDETFQELFAPMDSPTARATASSNTSAHLSADVLVRAFANTVSDSSYRDRGGDFDRLSTNETANSPSPSSKIVSNGAELSYEEFMFKFLRCKDLLAITRIFVLSVLGPKGDYSTPPSGRSAAGYKFFGLLRLEERCKEFFEDMHRRMKEHKEWQSRLISGRDMDEERWLSARDRLEQYVMDQIGEGAFRSVQSDEEDRLLLRQMKLLSFLTPEVMLSMKRLQSLVSRFLVLLPRPLTSVPTC